MKNIHPRFRRRSKLKIKLWLHFTNIIVKTSFFITQITQPLSATTENVEILNTDNIKYLLTV